MPALFWLFTTRKLNSKFRIRAHITYANKNRLCIFQCIRQPARGARSSSKLLFLPPFPCLHCILFVSDVVYPLLCLVTHILNFLHTAANNISILAGKQGCSRKVFALLKIVLVITVLFQIWSKMFSSKNISNAMLFCCCAFTLAMDHVSNVPWSNAFWPGQTPFGPSMWQAEADTELTLSASPTTPFKGFKKAKPRILSLN